MLNTPFVFPNCGYILQTLAYASITMNGFALMICYSYRYFVLTQSTSLKR